MQIGLLRFGLDVNEDAKMARFLGGLNHDIQDILDYKEYNSITRLFHLACKAKREVHGRQSRTHNSFDGSSFSRLPKIHVTSLSSTSTPPALVTSTPACHSKVPNSVPTCVALKSS